MNIDGFTPTPNRKQFRKDSNTYELTLESYKHGVIPNLITPDLLRHVRSEIQEHLSFTPKETDIYKIHQSGDLANLDGLDDSALKLLPSLLTLRNALYSAIFRDYLSKITGAGALSGKKTDMAINVYTPGCHLLCHDDVIGSRRVSYILYLTDPDKLWKEEWGGALRLYPTQDFTGKDGQIVKIPSPDSSVSIPPAFNQLGFFAVQPGQSFHDVEEVYAKQGEQEASDEDRVRMAISGWYHIPQEGEEGYVEGLEEKLAESSSLMQLQGKGDEFDLPVSRTSPYEDVEDDQMLSEEDLDFLLRYMAPTYLTPDTLESISDSFKEEFSLLLDTFLSKRFSDSLRTYISNEEQSSLPPTAPKIESTTSWTVATPPHKHRFLFQKQRDQRPADTVTTPVQDLLENLLPSVPFKKWLQLATGQTLTSHDGLARRFRKGKDYTLATSYNEAEPRLEIILNITPTSHWGGDEATQGGNDNPEQDGAAVGGYIAYMAADEDEGDPEDGGSDHGVGIPPTLQSTGASASFAPKKKVKSDPAVYKMSDFEEGEGLLFSMPAGWNRLGIVMRDAGTMRFVKYISRSAKGDRWDVVGEFGVTEEEGGDDEDGGEGAGGEVEIGQEAGCEQGEDDSIPSEEEEEEEEEGLEVEVEDEEDEGSPAPEDKPVETPQEYARRMAGGRSPLMKGKHDRIFKDMQPERNVDDDDDDDEDDD